jgi:hypothetical protein
MLFAGSAFSDTVPKTLIPEKIDPLLIDSEPYRFNGVVLTDEFRGSGFCAWNKRTFFTAAHMVWKTGWGAPPIWAPTANALTVDEDTQVQARGYFRWKSYASLVAVGGQTGNAFGKDVILAYAFQDLIPGTPAKLDLNAYKNLRGNRTTMITGYPALAFYTDQAITGYFMHQTGPGITPYGVDFGRALRTPLIASGPGNSGGPLWIKETDGSWSAAAVYVGGRPSESIVNAFSPDTNSLTQAVAPLVKTPFAQTSAAVAGIEGSSYFFPMSKPKKIPDGVTRFTDFKFNVGRFEDTDKLKLVKLSFEIETNHQGDLFIILQGPGGIQALVHNEQGGGTHDLVLTQKDFSLKFSGIRPNGNWMLRVQDRLRGDVATVKNILLELSADGKAPVPPTP